MKKRYVSLLCGAVCLLLLVLAGCQAVGGVDTGSLLLNAMDAPSYEGKQTISIEMKTDAKVEKGKPDLSVLNGMTIVLSEVKKQDSKTTSAKGELQLAKGKVPFRLSMNDKETALWVEGASKPVVFEFSASSYLTGGGESDSALPMDLGNLKDPEQLTKLLMPFIIKHLPNPSVIKAESVTETINGKAEALTKVHAEIKGSELPGLLKAFVESVLKDKEGLDKLMDDILTALMGPEHSPVIAAFAKAYIQELLPQLVEELESNEDVGGAFTDANGLKLDLYADSSLKLRKAGYELVLAPAADAGKKGLQELKIKGTAEFWNIGQTVKADLIDTKDAVKLGDGKGMPDFLRTLDKKSEAYKLLKDEVKIYRKNIQMPLKDGVPGEDDIRPYLNVEKEKTMVPVRFVTEKLDASVDWNGDTREVTVTDLYTGKQLVFTIDSETVLINGKAEELDAAAVINGGSTYVPIRIIAESFQCDVGWDGETRTVSIVRN